MDISVEEIWDFKDRAKLELLFNTLIAQAPNYFQIKRVTIQEGRERVGRQTVLIIERYYRGPIEVNVSGSSTGVIIKEFCKALVEDTSRDKST